MQTSLNDRNAIEPTQRIKAVEINVKDKYTLTILEAASYFNIGTKKLRRLAEDNLGKFSVFSGNKYLIIREKFERYLEQVMSL